MAAIEVVLEGQSGGLGTPRRAFSGGRGRRYPDINAANGHLDGSRRWRGRGRRLRMVDYRGNLTDSSLWSRGINQQRAAGNRIEPGRGRAVCGGNRW